MRASFPGGATMNVELPEPEQKAAVPHAYAALTPDLVMDAVESCGYLCDGRNLTLNSYENRVYQVGIEEAPPIIAKFYRPGRWTRETIQEEHAFALTLVEAEVPVVAPRVIHGTTMHHFRGFDFALFPRVGGHAPELEQEDVLYRIGQLLGRLHQACSGETFSHRPELSIQQSAIESRQFLLEHHFIPSGLIVAYDTLSADLIDTMQQRWQAHPFEARKLHGDFHLGNLLARDETLSVVDLDDCCNGPAIQDFWLMLSGERMQQTAQMMELIEGYEMFAEFNLRELNLIETLRTMRIMRYAAWLARRWDDPAFPHHFPWFNTERYWSEHILELREQFALLQEPPLKLHP
jgi:Ser/Thr protein kinase RdoA (MazF antagonist)